MTWQEVRQALPHQWLLVEAIEARSECGQRIVNELAIVDRFPDSGTAMRRYDELHEKYPARELYVFHTDREDLDIRERPYLGVRPR